MDYFTYGINRLAVRLALGYFVFGTLLFLMLLIEVTDFVGSLAVIFLIVASLSTAFILLLQLIAMFLNLKAMAQYLLAMAIALLNYPIAVVYLHFLI